MFGVSPNTAALFISTAADHHHARIDANPGSELGSRWVLAELGYCIENRQTRTCAALGVVVVRLGIAEVRHHPVAQILRHAPSEALDGLRSRAVILADHPSPFFGVEMAGYLGRSDEIAEQHR